MCVKLVLQPSPPLRPDATLQNELARLQRDMKSKAAVTASAAAPAPGRVGGGTAAAVAGEQLGGEEDDGQSCDYEVSDDEIEEEDA